MSANHQDCSTNCSVVSSLPTPVTTFFNSGRMCLERCKMIRSAVSVSNYYGNVNRVVIPLDTYPDRCGQRVLFISIGDDAHAACRDTPRHLDSAFHFVGLKPRATLRHSFELMAYPVNVECNFPECRNEIPIVTYDSKAFEDLLNDSHLVVVVATVTTHFDAADLDRVCRLLQLCRKPASVQWTGNASLLPALLADVDQFGALRTSTAPMQVTQLSCAVSQCMRDEKGWSTSRDYAAMAAVIPTLMRLLYTRLLLGSTPARALQGLGTFRVREVSSVNELSSDNSPSSLIECFSEALPRLRASHESPMLVSLGSPTRPGASELSKLRGLIGQVRPDVRVEKILVWKAPVVQCHLFC